MGTRSANKKARETMVQETAIRDSWPLWLRVAVGELGQEERPGVKDNVRIREYHASTRMGARPDSVPWCSSFVNWCLLRAGVNGTSSAAAKSWVDWGVSAGGVYKGETHPPRGAIIVLYNPRARGSKLTRSGNHVGFLMEIWGGCVRVLGGNQGNRVCNRWFSLMKWTVVAVRWPTPGSVRGS
jgi:uncharacterized protein (TIGR02594 family)